MIPERVATKVGRTLRAIALAAAVWPGVALAQLDPPVRLPLPEPPIVGIVDYANGGDVPIRQTPNGPEIRRWPVGTLLSQLGEIEPGPSGHVWERVRDSDGNEGWIRSDNLLPIPMPPR